MNIEKRLLEWARWRHEPGITCSPRRTVMGRIKDEERNAGDRPAGFAYQMVDDVPCMPDGGAGRMVERMANSLDFDKRCREIQAVVEAMPTEHRAVLDAIYNALPGEIPREERDAAARMKMSRPTFRERKARMLGWIEGVFCGRAAA